MMTAARYPEKISRADCLNPTALCDATLKRLNRNWDKISSENQPIINVFAHLNDPVFLLENNFLANTHIFRFGKMNETESLLAAHAHYFAGRKSILITEVVDIQQDIPSRQREFVTDLKEMLNWFFFPFMYLGLVYELSKRKLQSFCDHHSTLINILLYGLILSALGVGVVFLIASGAITPLLALITAQIGTALTYALIGGVYLAASISARYVIPKLVKATELIIFMSVYAVISGIALVSALSIGSAIFLIKRGFKSFFKGHSDQTEARCEDSTLEHPIINESTAYLFNTLDSTSIKTNLTVRLNEAEKDQKVENLNDTHQITEKLGEISLTLESIPVQNEIIQNKLGQS